MKTLLKILKRILKIFVIFVILMGILIIWGDQSRYFFRASNGEYITMWKRSGGPCYLIPGKYYGITKPKDGYVEISNHAILTIYYSNKLPNIILLRKESNDEYKVFNPINKKYLFEDYTFNEKKYDPIIYKKGEVSFSDINKDASLLIINIQEEYASTEKGDTQR